MSNNAFPLPFPYVPGTQEPDSFEDRAQQNFEALAMAVGERPQALGVLQLAVAGTQRKVAFGTVTIAWPGGTPLSNIATVTHGLGVVPQTIQVSGAGGQWTLPIAFSPTATTFQVRGREVSISPAAGATDAIYWLAIG